MQVTIKITKWRVVLAIIILILGSKFYKYARQPFMFELFGSQKAAQKYFDENAAAWSDRGGGGRLAREIDLMGGHCTLNIPQEGESKPKQDFQYRMFYGCEYYNDYFSIDPFFYYRIVIYIDIGNKIVKNNVYRFPIEYLP